MKRAEETSGKGKGESQWMSGNEQTSSKKPNPRLAVVGRGSSTRFGPHTPPEVLKHGDTRYP